ncbi:hypothetical protein Pla100_06360 [Neorhodopirellula pilleata]|uniref:Uncharacterized protein n=1 Tax=Neorhodopirellula pilleata TaxID=2714738 RepID=A0A5C6AXB1_9BACT|nr:hypothetical protein Pla100_06360 [Neorhodopirellula pilleata]
MSSDEADEELPQKPLPRFSIRWMIGLVTVAAVFFAICQIAVGGNRWAQVFVLLVGIAFATVMSYAALFLFGMAWDSFFTNRGVARRPTGRRGQPTHLVGETTPPEKRLNSEKIVVWLAAMLLALSGSKSFADVNWVGTYPTGGKMLDYTMLVGTEKQPGQGGYLNLHLQFTPTRRVFTAEHNVTVFVSSHHHYMARLAATTSQSFKLDQSGEIVTHQMLIPHFTATNQLQIWVTEDGQEVSDRKLTAYLNGNQFTYVAQRWTIGIVHRGLNDPHYPDVRSLTTIFGKNENTLAPIPEEDDKSVLTWKEKAALVSQTQAAFVQYRSLEQPHLAEHWLAYSDLDLVIVEASLWSELKESNPSVVDSLSQFVAAGGVLLLFGTDAAILETKASFGSQIFEKPSGRIVPKPADVIARLDLSGPNDTSPLSDLQWNGSITKQSQYGNNQFRTRKAVYDDLVKTNSEMVAIVPPEELADTIETAVYGLGKILLIHQENPFPGSFQFWMTLEAVLLEKPLATPWVQRHGLRYDHGNTNYWRWLIDSVGGPPVKAFLTLNTLFVLIVGPIAYLVLRKFDRMYFLYFGAPALAVFFTSGLFVYAFFSDGLGTKLRTHQWTWVDADNQVVVSQDRSSIYSSFGTDALRFDRQSLVLPVLPLCVQDFSRNGNIGFPPNGRVRWTDEAQYWSGDFLPTRSQVQYQVIRPETGTPSPLSFERKSDADQVLVHNRSHLAIGPLVYRDSKSRYHFVDRVAAGASMVMQPSSQQAVGDLISDDELPPVGLVPNVRSNWSRAYNPNNPADDRPMLERRLERWMRSLPSNGFVGLSEVDPARFPTESSEVSIATHIIMGLAK